MSKVTHDPRFHIDAAKAEAAVFDLPTTYEATGDVAEHFAEEWNALVHRIGHQAPTILAQFEAAGLTTTDVDEILSTLRTMDLGAWDWFVAAARAAVFEREGGTS
jgi:hypothetical protein